MNKLREHWVMEFKKEIVLGRIQMKYLLQSVNSFVFQNAIMKRPQETQCSFWSAVPAISLHNIMDKFNFQQGNSSRGTWKPL